LNEVPVPSACMASANDPWPKKWVAAIRLPFLTASLMSVVAAIAACWWAYGPVRWGFAGLALAGIALIHAGANLANDYFDYRSGADPANLCPTPFSGGSRVLVEGVLTPRAVLAAAVLFTLAGCACGIYLWRHTPGYTLLIIGMMGVALAWLYVAPPVRLAHRGVGELAVGVCFGILPAMGTEWVLRGRLSPEGSWVGVPAGLLVAAILLINEFPDAAPDAFAGKRTLMVRLGPGRAALLYAALLALMYASVLAAVLLRWMPALAALVFLVTPLSVRITRLLHAKHGDVPALIPGMAGTILQQVVVLLVLTGAYVADLALRTWR